MLDHSQRTNDELTLTLHGLDGSHREVDGEVFAEKFSALIEGLKLADTEANGDRRHRFLISGLSKNTATISVREEIVGDGDDPASSFGYYQEGIVAIDEDTPAARRLPRKFIECISRMGEGAGETFARGEIKRGSFGKAVFISTSLGSNGKKILSDIKKLENDEKLFFKGRAYSAFDGVLLMLDSRGETEKAVLQLTAGGKSIRCNVDKVDYEVLRRAWRQRCNVQGLALYSGESGLPEQIDVRAIRVIESSGHLSAWQGAFEGLSVNDEAWC